MSDEYPVTEDAEVANHFYSGTWRTHPKKKLYSLKASENNLPVPSGPKTWLIKCPTWSADTPSQFKLTVDGVELLQPFHEGGSVVIQGDNIWIEQVDEGSTDFGTWEAIAEDKIATYASEWKVSAESGVGATLASFSKPVEAVIAFGKNIDLPVNALRSYIEIVVDGITLRTKNQGAVALLPSSSVLVEGRLFQIKVAHVEGDIPSRQFFGQIFFKLADIKPPQLSQSDDLTSPL